MWFVKKNLFKALLSYCVHKSGMDGWTDSRNIIPPTMAHAGAEVQKMKYSFWKFIRLTYCLPY